MQKDEPETLDGTLLEAFLRQLCPKEAAFLRPLLSLRSLHRGEILLREGERDLPLMFLLRGTLKIQIEGVSRPQILRLVRPSECVIPELTRTAPAMSGHAIAIEDSLILLTDTAAWPLLEQCPDLQRQIADEAARDLMSLRERLVALTQKHVRGRLADTILYLEQRMGCEPRDGQTLRARLTREDLAFLSSMTAPNVIRTLAQFAQEDLILIHRREIRILDHLRLERISRQG